MTRPRSTRSVVTDERGGYVITNLLPGRYTVTAELEGFKKTSQSGYVLTADGRLTADIALSVGGVTETIEVAAVAGETINRTSGEIARVVDSTQVQNLALNARNYLQLATLIPGSALTDFNPLAATTSLGTGTQSINGNRGGANNLNVDGVFNLASGSNSSMVNNVGIDFIQEVKLQTSNFSAEYGRNSGASINVVTKSGTNEFRGSAVRIPAQRQARCEGLLRRAQGQAALQRLRRLARRPDSEGQAVLLRRRRIQEDPPGNPLAHDDADDRVPQRRFLRAADAARVPGDDDADSEQQHLGADYARGPLDRRIYDAMQQRATGFDDRNVGNNTTFQEPNPFDWREVIARVDYRLNNNHSFYYRFIWDSVHADRSVRHVPRRQHADDADAADAAVAEQSGGVHVDRDAVVDQRIEGERGVARPAHSARG